MFCTFLFAFYLFICLFSQDITNCANTAGIELSQNILVVFNAPLVLDGRYSWTLNSLFNNALQSYCPLSSSSHVYIEASHLHAINGSKLLIEPTSYVRLSNANQKFDLSLVNDLASMTDTRVESIYADYDFQQMFDEVAKQNRTSKPTINIGIQYPDTYQAKLPSSSSYTSVSVRRHARGYGVSSGGLSLTITNSFDTDIYAIYLDMIPWYFRMYLHTMIIEAHSLNNPKGQPRSIKPSWLHYEPGQDRVRPHHLEVMLLLPAKSQVEVRFEFENQFLRWTEYPPDANHGLYINPASVTFFLPSNAKSPERFLPQLFALLNSASGTSIGDATRQLDQLQQFYPLRLYTEPILISMPTPDFSMPYNVVCLVSTVLSIAFGPIHNLTTRRTRLIRKYLGIENKSANTTKDGAQTKDKIENTKKRRCLVM